LGGSRKKKQTLAQADLELDLDNMLKDLSANPVTVKKSKGSKKKKSRQAGSALSSFFQGGSAGSSRRKAQDSALFSTATMDAATDQQAPDVETMDNDDEIPDAPDAPGAGEPASDEQGLPKLTRQERLMKAAREDKSVRASAAAQKLLNNVNATAGASSGRSGTSSVGDAAFGTEFGGGSSIPSEVNLDMSSLPLEQDERGQFLRLFWIDIYEHRDQPGKIFLFGKVQVPTPAGKTPHFVSCCVVVQNLQRQLLVLPRKEKKSSPGSEVKMGDVHREVSDLLGKFLPGGAGAKFKCKIVERDYAFEHHDVPREKSKYLKVVYPAVHKVPSVDVCESGGDTFVRIFGARTKIIENFLLKRDMMGPSWLKIRNISAVRSSMTWCKFEVTCGNPKDVAVFPDAPPAPHVVVMSLSLKTVLNPRHHTHEVVVVSAMTHPEVMLDGPTMNPEQKIRHVTAVRPLGTTVGTNTQFPLGFQQRIKQNRNLSSIVEVCANERGLLSFLMARIHKEDPDVIVGHNIFGFDLDVLMARLSENKIPMWSKLGRLRRNKRPYFKQHSGVNGIAATLSCGRLIVDTYLAARESLKQTTYTLTSLCDLQLGKSRQEIDPINTPGYYDSHDKIIALCRNTNQDAYLVMCLMFKLEVLPLSKQLTNISGNVWNRSLQGRRAERIEFLLLHEFHRLKYILPEKKVFNEKDKGGRRAGQSGRKKAGYGGGLVLEPKKGLYDKYVLLLDFMSLYPSIIQEYNLCFSTVDRQLMGNSSDDPVNAQGEEEPLQLPDLPDETKEKGILPRVIRTLVQRRRQVKKMLKQEKNPVTKQQLDVRQMALKLTANSMYGCLGFSNSRFYAKPIAALVTGTGRDILQRTVEIAENTLNLEVIYGDTDSIMIHTRETDLVKVKAMGVRVVKEVNKHYKELELEIDGVFKSMLLLKKKKYAALTIVDEKPNPQGGPALLKLKKEVKGLDMVRREWCPLSKAAGQYTLDCVLSGDACEDVVHKIHSYLDDVAAKMRAYEVPLEKYVMTKGLNKAPNDYPDANGQPHLKVALKMLQAGKHVNVGDHIPYVICTKESAQTDSGSPADRAFHPEEVLRSEGKLILDIEWYLGQQMHSPVARLIEPVEGTSSAMIAEHLGLDASKFRNVSSASNGYEEADVFDYLSARLDDAERFKDAEPLMLTCRACKLKFPFAGCFHFADKHANTSGVSGLFCPNTKCQAELFGFAAGRTMSSTVQREPGDDEKINCVALLSNNLQLAIRKSQKTYYDRWLVSEDPTENIRTQQQSVRQDKFLVGGRWIRTRAEYSDMQLYNQLKYYESLFDWKRSERKLTKENEGRRSKGMPMLTVQLPRSHKEVLDEVKTLVSERIEQSAYNWVRPTLWSAVFGANKE
jgi:DNA polymerase alpha subunit A